MHLGVCLDWHHGTANAENDTMLFKLAELHCIALSNNAEKFFIWSFQGLYLFLGGIVSFEENIQEK